MSMELLTHPMNLFWLCMLGHLISDFYLQGCLCDLKQKKWWDNELKKIAYSTQEPKTPDEQSAIFERYKHDFIAGLYCHSLMWSILTFIPLMLACGPGQIGFIIILNCVIHAVVDNMKANQLKINLCQDQLLHFAQICITVLLATHEL